MNFWTELHNAIFSFVVVHVCAFVFCGVVLGVSWLVEKLDEF